MDDLGPEVVLVEYTASLTGTAAETAPAVLSVDDVRDLAWVTVDGTRVGTLERAVGDLALASRRAER